MSQNQKSHNQVVQLSQDYIYKAKTGDTISEVLSALRQLDYGTLLQSLTTDNDKKAFWINVYNGYTQAALKETPEKYRKRSVFFNEKGMQVAGNFFSLDAIEHGILRHSKIKWGLGYLTNLFPYKREKDLRVDTLDYRIHFALNCGATSCPPIAFYNPENLEVQLELATKAYLSSEVEYNSTKNKVWLPKLMRWFQADFGGKKGILKLLKKHNSIPQEAYPTIKFKKYDWTLSLNNYTN